MKPNKGVQILKERFYQQKVLSAHNDAESNISERKIGSIYSWLEGVRQVNTSNISKMQCKVKIFSLSHQIISDIWLLSWLSRDLRDDESSDNEYLVPRPMSQVSGCSHEDMDMVIKQISMAVSKTRGASLSKAVSRGRKRSDKSKYPYKVCSASLPRPKLKRLQEPGHHYYNVSVQERGPETPVRRHSPSHYHPETRPCHPSSTDHYYTVSRPGSGNY